MKTTKHSKQTTPLSSSHLPAYPLGSTSLDSMENVPPFPAISQDFPPFPSDNLSQVTHPQQSIRKWSLGNFAENISPQQRAQLIEWLGDHTYEDTAELVAQEPPHGFGIKVGKSTIARFYKAHYQEIYRSHRERIQSRMFQTIDFPDGPDFRYVLRDSYSQLLLEHLWGLLSQPVNSADDLKKLVLIAEKMKFLDRDKEHLEEMKSEAKQSDIEQLMAAIKPRAA